MGQQAFRLGETTIADIHSAYRGGTLTARRLVQMYLDRIESYDKKGPSINAVIALSPKAIQEADRLLGPGKIPDIPTRALRDYGNRIGVSQIMEVHDRYNVRATVALNSDIRLPHPEIIEDGNKRGWEWRRICLDSIS